MVLLVGLAVSACGQIGDTVPVRILTGLENQGPVKNLMEGLTNLPQKHGWKASVSCVQPEVLVGYKFAPGVFDIRAFKFPIKTAAQPVAGDYTTWLKNYGSGTAPVIPVPRGALIGLGVFGALYDSSAMSADGTCATVNAAGTPYPSASMAGTVEQFVNEAMDVLINVWVVGVTDTPSVPSGCAPGTNSIKQDCPNRNFYDVDVSCTTCTELSSFSYYDQMEYLFGEPGSPIVQHRISSADFGGGAQIPQADHYHFKIVNVANDSILAEVKFDEKSLDWAGNVAIVNVQNRPPLATSVIQLTITRQ